MNIWISISIWIFVHRKMSTSWCMPVVSRFCAASGEGVQPAPLRSCLRHHLFCLVCHTCHWAVGNRNCVYLFLSCLLVGCFTRNDLLDGWNIAICCRLEKETGWPYKFKVYVYMLIWIYLHVYLRNYLFFPFILANKYTILLVIFSCFYWKKMSSKFQRRYMSVLLRGSSRYY